MLVIALILLAVIAVSSAAPCGYQYAPGVTYDVGALQITAGPTYVVDDAIDTQQRNYLYDFNVCGPLLNLPRPPVATGPGCFFNDSHPQLAPAYQVFNDTSGRCVLLGDAAQQSWSLYDPTNAAAGVTLTYGGGDLCRSVNPPKARQFSINFVCAPTLRLTPSSRVQEDVRAVCEYEVSFFTQLACPRGM